MKRLAVFASFAAVLLFAVLFLSACSGGVPEKTVKVMITEDAGFTADVGCDETEPGGSVYFYIYPDPGFSVTGTDYDGPYTLTQASGRTRLELQNVRYPTRVRLTLSRSSVTVRYVANGGNDLTAVGKEVSETYDIRTHIRPNVSTGTSLFERDGYVLTGWNTEADGSGQRIGLGSRMSADGDVTLYAQWAEWTPLEYFSCRITDGGDAVITGCSYEGETVVVPETVGGCPVTVIYAHAFTGCTAKTVILPKSVMRIEDAAFDGAELSELYLYDNVEYISDASFTDCANFSTLRINAIEDPYGYSFRRESLLADKFDMLIETMGEERLIFYGGCSMWYNLIGTDVTEAFGGQLTVINMAVNGLTTSLFQMEIMKQFMTDRDILFHTPEISSIQQLMGTADMTEYDDKFWCAMEYDYDLVSLVDIRIIENGLFDSLHMYLDKKKPGGSYTDTYADSKGRTYLDATGCIPYYRDESTESLADEVYLDPSYISDLSRLENEYSLFAEKGIRIYVTYAVIDIDQVPDDQRDRVSEMGRLYTEKFSAMDGVTVFGDIWDFIYHDGDFFDTVYHLLTIPAKNCTAVWIRDLTEQMESDGLLYR